MYIHPPRIIVSVTTNTTKDMIALFHNLLLLLSILYGSLIVVIDQNAASGGPMIVARDYKQVLIVFPKPWYFVVTIEGHKRRTKSFRGVNGGIVPETVMVVVVS